MARVTPLKGATFESDVNAVMEGIAVGLGDEYRDTGRVAGTMQRCLKGDGMLSGPSCSGRVGVEMHDSPDRRAWNDYSTRQNATGTPQPQSESSATQLRRRSRRSACSALAA